ncbi:hypothetical protein [Actinoplanes regularis]|uniref:Uncharacterized protein n=1 Tax=Actinoplanes regularis TaxID=52697 RepID=A0A239DQ21_9ACTN|nr:hypothetical protein [Actinoplanes regularis]GIE89089.1 hypothetical protein Are01nite_55690 [Actinoplanes regularis]SNS33852.1 hypothetical protein SAMN06264365_11411 [Actinoplanes regularis]
MPASFVPQPYPLFAVILRKVDDPARFELADDEPRLVLGWITGDLGQTLPALAGGSPSGTVWDGPVFFEETRERAERLAKEVGRADRAAARSAKVVASMDRLDPWFENRAASIK